MADFSVYIHLPFCKTRCAYCDFYSTVEASVPYAHYGRAVEAEWRQRRRTVEETGRLKSLYVGGGTPSLWPVESIAAMLDMFGLLGDEEVTVEVNPRDADAAWFEGLVRAGANRFSIGVQAMDDNRLRFLGRPHSADDGVRAVRSALGSGARSVSADLIFGTPGHRVDAWRREMNALADLGVHHISAYQLTVAEGTPLYVRQDLGERVSAGEDQTARLYRATRSELKKCGFSQYEVSNFARGRSHRSMHNLHYWRGGLYLGLGAGAHGFVRHGDELIRYADAEDVSDYLAAAKNISIPKFDGLGNGGLTERLSQTDHARERMMLGLRTVEGAPFEEIICTVQAALREKWRREAEMLVGQKLARFRNGRLVPTARGLIRADGMAERFF